MSKLNERPCDWCQTVFTPTRPTGRFCSRGCTNTWQRSIKPEVMCPCGNVVGKAPGKKTKSAFKKFCSPECTKRYQKRNQPNPENYHTFECLNCGTEVTRRKSYNHGSAKYCSNNCAMKHTKKKHHIVLKDDDVLLDSSYEAFFYGAVRLLKIPVERFNRKHGVEWAPGKWYAPDFYLPTYDLAVELKGLEDSDDQERWLYFRQHSGELLTWDRDRLLTLSPMEMQAIFEG